MKSTSRRRSLFVPVFLSALTLFPFAVSAGPVLTNGVLTESTTAVSGSSGDDQLVLLLPTNVVTAVTLSSNPDNPVLASTTGINGFAGNDSITNGASLHTLAATSISAPLKSSETIGHALSIGLAGGAGSNLVVNSSSLISTSYVRINVGEFLPQPIEMGLSGGDNESRADSIGILGGSDGDVVINSGALRADAGTVASLTKAKISLFGLPLDLFATGDTSTRSIASATGIFASPDELLSGTASNSVFNIGTLTVSAVSTSQMTQLNLELFGASRINGMTTSTGTVAGITGNAGNDQLVNSGAIDGKASAVTVFGSMEIKKKGLFVKTLADLVADVGKFNGIADAEARGIDGGAGDDILRNNAAAGINVSADALAMSDEVTLAINIPTPSAPEPAGLDASVAAIDPVDTNSVRLDPYADASTRAHSRVNGMAGGQGDDQILNSGSVAAAANARAQSLGLGFDVSISADNYIPLPGAAITDTSVAATAAASGLDGGDGNDVIDNAGTVNASAAADGDSTTISGVVNATLKGFAFGVTLSDSSSQTESSAVGISGGTGIDVITNRGILSASAAARNNSFAGSGSLTFAKTGLAFGVALSDASSDASAVALGIDTGADTTDLAGDTIVNASSIRTRAGATNSTTGVSIGFSVSIQGVAGGVSAARTDGAANAIATGIRTGNGDDFIAGQTNGWIDAGAAANSDSTSVSVEIAAAWQGAALGASLAKSTTEATAASIGIETAGGNDTILNANAVTNNAFARADSDVVAITISGAYEGVAFGASLADGRTIATTDAIGINTGSGNDTNLNTAAIFSSAKSDSQASVSSITVSVPVKGVSAGLSAALAGAQATNRVSGINLGAGDDALLQASSVDVQAEAKARVGAISINVAMVGAAVSDASSTARASSTGLDGGSGSDWIQNQGRLNVTAKGEVNADGVTANLVGYASGDISMTNIAEAVGIQGGEIAAGQTFGDTLLNATNGTVTVLADSRTAAGIHVVQLGGAVFANTEAIAVSRAAGIAGGALGDTIGNDGSISVTAQSQISASTAKFELAGIDGGRAGLGASSTATGLSGGGGSNVLWNSASGVITSHARASTLTLGMDGNILGASIEASTAGSTAVAIGISAGGLADFIDNRGVIESSSYATGCVGTVGISLFSFKLSSSLAEAIVKGIDAGAGDDTILNAGTINVGRVQAGDRALADTFSLGAGFDLLSFVMTSMGSSATIAGIDAGAGDDTIQNDGAINAGFENQTLAQGDTYGVGGQVVGTAASFAGGTTTATATGVDGGDGSDQIINTASGSITAHSASKSTVTSETDLGIGILFPTVAEADATANSTARGIQGGAGNDLISNAGNVRAVAEATGSTSATGTMGLDIDTWVYSDSTAKANATAMGLDLGNGTNTAWNSGFVSAQTIAKALAAGNVDTTMESAESKATTVPVSIAKGISGADGPNLVVNGTNGSVYATASAVAQFDLLGTPLPGAWALSLDGRDSYARAGLSGTPMSATASGIALGSGNNVITNQGFINTFAIVNGQAAARSDSDVRHAFADAQSYSRATSEGIAVGGGRNLIVNDGGISVDSIADTTAAANATGFWYSPTAQSYNDVRAYGYGIRAGSGGNIIINNGSIAVTTDASGNAYAWAEEDAGGGCTETARATVNATSRSYGIWTGDGNDTVINAGFITASSSASVTVSAETEDNDVETRNSSKDVVATGISTGDGDDLVVNSGSIWTVSPSGGVAISASYGNDRIYLGDGSLTRGSILLGQGNDTLTVEGIAVVDGNIAPGDGTDTLVLRGTGEFRTPELIIEQLIKDGDGLFVLDGLKDRSLEKLEVQQGTLRLDGNYTFSEWGNLAATICPDANGGVLQIAGTASLDGALTIYRMPGPYTNGTTQTILQAGDVSSTFQSVTLPEWRPLLSFQLNYLSDAVQVEALAASFTTVANNSLQRSIGRYLDRALPLAQGEFSSVIAEFQSLELPQFAAAFASLSPSVYDADAVATIDLGRDYIRSVQQHMSASRVRREHNGNPASQPKSFGQVASLSGGPVNAEMLQQPGQPLRTEFWLSGLGSWEDQESSADGFAGFRSSAGGGGLGMDFLGNDRFLGGVHVGYARTHLSLDDDLGGGNADNYFASAYGTWLGKSGYLEGTLAYSRHQYDNRRKIEIGNIESTARSEHAGNAVSAQLGTGTVCPAGPWQLRPRASLLYTYLDQSGFTESGADSLNLHVEGHGAHSLKSELGMEIARPFRFGENLLVPEVGVAWEHDFGIDDRAITSSFEGLPGNTFTVARDNVEADSTRLHAGIVLVHGNRFLTALNFDAILHQNHTAHAVSGELRIAF